MPKNQDSTSPTKINSVGLSPTNGVVEPPKKTVSESCTKGDSSDALKAKVPPKKYSLESYTRKDFNLIAEVECSPTLSNDKVIINRQNKNNQ